MAKVAGWPRFVGFDRLHEGITGHLGEVLVDQAVDQDVAVANFLEKPRSQ